MKLILIGIIPILLLIGLSTSVIINSNLINSASKMETSIEETYQEEQELGDLSVSIGNTTYNSVEEYINSPYGNY